MQFLYDPSVLVSRLMGRFPVGVSSAGYVSGNVEYVFGGLSQAGEWTAGYTF